MKKVILFKALFTFALFFIFVSFLPNSIEKHLSNNCNISIVKAADDENQITLNVTSKSLVKEATFTLKVLNYDIETTQKITFKSSNSDIASVSSKGVIIANRVGTAIITVTVRQNSKSVDTLECEITVGPPAISVKLNKSELKLTVGDRYMTLKAILKPSNTADEVYYVSLNPTVATVTSNGRIIAKTIGETTIVAMAGDKYDICTVYVTDAPSTTEENTN